MRIGGLLRTSFSDFPSRIAAVVFTRGCNFRCPYCHNPDLVEGDAEVAEAPTEAEVLSFLERRRGQLDGVVVTGGEPTVQADLTSFLGQVRNLGLEVKLDTNGSRPDVLASLLDAGLVDFVAVDVKAPLGRYRELVGVEVDPREIARSVEIVLGQEVGHEFRTTVVHPLLGLDDLLAIGETVRGCGRYVLQPFVPGRTLLPQLEARSPAPDEMRDLCGALREAGVPCEVRPHPASAR